ncbi:MAG: hypothetical protein KIT31_41120, partial [Deltaproteobacteria bacterium]|nr:hypothetical protein [Deltaproteobacteria bacterium]
MAEPPKLDGSDAVPPGLHYQIRDVLRRLPVKGEPPDPLILERLGRVIADGEGWLGAEPALADVGLWMLGAQHDVELRRRGCAWLAMFPTADVMQRVAAAALDAGTPAPVREAAIATLGDRRLGGKHRATLWSADAIHVADEALVRLADAATAAGALASERLPHALRGVQGDAIAAVFARAPGLWGEAIECFSTAPLARVLFVSVDDIPPQHRPRVLRVIAATLGEEAVPLLAARAANAPLDMRLEMLFLAVALGGEAHLPRLEEEVRALKFKELLRERARWHLANKGVVPTVRGLRTARTTATIPAGERAERCGRAADDLAALAKFERYAEAYVYAMWAAMVRASGDPVRARELVAAHPESQHRVRELYLADLAKRGRVRQLTAAAQTLAAADLGALQLAIWGRPIAALELAATARHHTPELACARALACYRAGRADLFERILAEDLPPSELVDDEALRPFPGPHETWLAENAKEAVAVAALVR